MKSRSAVLMVVIAVVLIPRAVIDAQTKRPHLGKSSSAVSEAEVMALANRLGRAKREVTAAANDYKASLAKLLALQENDVKSASETVERRKELHAQAIISKREVEDSERSLSAAEDKVADTKRQIAESDDLIADAIAEEVDTISYARRLLAEKKKRERTPTGRVYYVTFIIVGEITIYEYSGAIKGEVIKHRAQVKYDSRRSF
jgi:hypothetical protein